MLACNRIEPAKFIHGTLSLAKLEYYIYCKSSDGNVLFFLFLLFLTALRFKLENLKGSFPSDIDFGLIAHGLTRMQYLNGIDIKGIVNGTICGKQSLQKPNVADLFRIARMAYDREDFYTAITWLKEATKISSAWGPSTGWNFAW